MLQLAEPDAKMPRLESLMGPNMESNDTRKTRSFRGLPFARGSEPSIAIVTALLAGLIALASRLPNIVTRVAAGSCGLLWLLILYFFRDPERVDTDLEPGVVLSAGDGEVVEIARERESTYLRRDMIRISVFLSIFDVHVQRVPIDGKVSHIHHQPGRYLQAFRPEASSVNEHIATLIETDHGPVLVKQIAGILARRCVNYLQPGDYVNRGQRFGLIRFGSRVDLFVTPNAEILAAVGDRVAGALTPVARLSEAA